MAARLRRVALTGGIATGKSYCLTRFAELGAPTIDADVLARQAVAPGTPGFAAVRERFGQAILRRDGSLDRDALGRLVFSDVQARRDLEEIIHPQVYEGVRGWFERLEASPNPVPIAIADIPLVFETGHEADFDSIIVVRCLPEQQLERLMARTGLSEADAQQRIDTQLPIGVKASRADYVIDTSGSFAETNLQVVQIWGRVNEEKDVI